LKQAETELQTQAVAVVVQEQVEMVERLAETAAQVLLFSVTQILLQI
jgi:hypothetical protein